MKKLTLIYIITLLTPCLAQIKTEEILIKNNKIELPGTLTYQLTKSPLLIYVNGSGNGDRNGNQALLPETNFIKVFRDEITKNGISFFSYDKRTATKKNLPLLKGIVFEDFVKDLEKVISKFKEDNRFSKIIVMGHSQGSLVAMLAKTEFSKFISLAGPARPINEIIVDQIKANNPTLASIVKEHFKELKETGTIKSVNMFIQNLFNKQNNHFLRSWMQYDPRKEIAKMNKSIALIQGTMDSQVPTSEARALHQANKNSKLHLIKDMNHVLKTVKNKKENMESYISTKYPISKDLIDTVTNIILKE